MDFLKWGLIINSDYDKEKKEKEKKLTKKKLDSCYFSCGERKQGIVKLRGYQRNDHDERC